LNASLARVSESPLSASAYEVLGVRADASEEELRRAYRSRLRETHPDTGGDPAAFIAVQQAWELVGEPAARAVYDRGSRAAAPPPPEHEQARRTDGGRPRARVHGHPGGWRRERYLTLVREWAGRGVELRDPYDDALVRSAPRELRHMLADALAEEASARVLVTLGIGYTVWHDVSTGRGRRAGDPDAKLDHVVLGPSGLYALLSEDFGGPVRARRGELIGEAVAGETPVADLVSRMRALSRTLKVRFSGGLVVLPDDALEDPSLPLGSVRGTPVHAVRRSVLAHVLREGLPGARPVGGTELFELRTRLQNGVSFV